jgi:hypothetical protein
MTQSLIEKYKAKYPLQFSNYLRGRDIEIPDGWINLVDEMINKFCTEYPAIRFRQIKEKFGELRVYESFSDEILDDEAESISSMLNEYVNRSYSTCSVCGSTENVDRGPGYWIYYACPEHRKPKS